MNLSEEKKLPLRDMPMENKKKLLISHYKQTSQVGTLILSDYSCASPAWPLLTARAEM